MLVIGYWYSTPAWNSSILISWCWLATSAIIADHRDRLGVAVPVSQEPLWGARTVELEHHLDVGRCKPASWRWIAQWFPIIFVYVYIYILYSIYIYCIYILYIYIYCIYIYIYIYCIYIYIVYILYIYIVYIYCIYIYMYKYIYICINIYIYILCINKWDVYILQTDYFGGLRILILPFKRSF